MQLVPRFLLLAALAAVLAACGAAEQGTRVAVYRTPSCGCCLEWVDHLEAAGFSVEVTEVQDLQAVKASHGVPRGISSCHTALVDGYVVEGHVPARDVQRMLAERPPITGLAVPGMPIGSPGMEGPDPEPYDVLAFDERGGVEVFSSYRP
jgi:hypothetical protein